MPRAYSRLPPCEFCVALAFRPDGPGHIAFRLMLAAQAFMHILHGSFLAFEHQKRVVNRLASVPSTERTTRA
eukprot:6194332-Pleurochrysis_carterae.AAC.5